MEGYPSFQKNRLHSVARNIFDHKKRADYINQYNQLKSYVSTKNHKMRKPTFVGRIKTQKEKLTIECWHLPIFTPRRQGTIFGTTGLNFRVRDGNGWGLSVIGTGFLYVIAKFPLLQQLFQFGDR